MYNGLGSVLSKFRSLLKSMFSSETTDLTRRISKNMMVEVIPALSDNYMYVIRDENKNAAVIDPYDYNKVSDYVNENELNLKYVLTTHHHKYFVTKSDHAGGNDGLILCHPDVEIFGGSRAVNSVNRIIGDGNVLELGSLQITCISTPGHTKDHICYFITDLIGDYRPCVFTGDTLFIGGCGRLFEGTPSDMYESLLNKLACLPPETVFLTLI